MPPQLGSDDDDQVTEVEMMDTTTANGANEPEVVSVETGNTHSEDHVMTDSPSHVPSMFASSRGKTPETSSHHPISAADVARLSLTPAIGVDSTKPLLLPSAQKERNEQISAFTRVLSETPADVAQKVLRDNWRFFLFENYNEWHVQYVLRAGIKNSNQAILNKILKDDGPFKSYAFQLATKDESVKRNVLAAATMQELLDNAQHGVLNNINEQLLRKVLQTATSAQAIACIQPSVLDDILKERIKTADAKALITWLAQAERLGFAADDIVDENEEVIPNIEQGDVVIQEPRNPHILPPAANTTNTPGSYYVAAPAEMGRDPLLAEQERNAAQSLSKRHEQPSRQSNIRHSAAVATRPPNLKCPLCKETPPTSSGYAYHVDKRVCEKTVKSGSAWAATCSNCLQGFTTKQGKDYHVIKHVCGGETLSMPQAHESGARPLPPRAADSGPSVVVPRPSFTVSAQDTPRPQPNSSSSTPSRSSTPTARPGMPGRPPLGTPKGKQHVSDEVRGSPSDLPPDRLAALNAELVEADRKMQQGIAGIPADWDDPRRRAKIESLKNINGSKKSQTRKKYGVTLRKREKDKIGMTRMSNVGSAGSSPAPISEEKRVEIEHFRAQPRLEATYHQPSSSAAASPQSHQANPSALTVSQLPQWRHNPATVPHPYTFLYGPPPHESQDPTSHSHYPTSHPPSNISSHLPHTSLPQQSPSGFGMLRLEDPEHLTQSNHQGGQYMHPNPHSNKRPRYANEEQPPRPRPNGGQFRAYKTGRNGLVGSGTGLVEVRVEDAASKFPPKQGPFGPRTEAEMRTVATSTLTGSSNGFLFDEPGTIESAIIIDDSDTEGGALSALKAPSSVPTNSEHLSSGHTVLSIDKPLPEAASPTSQIAKEDEEGSAHVKDILSSADTEMADTETTYPAQDAKQSTIQEPKQDQDQDQTEADHLSNAEEAYTTPQANPTSPPEHGETPKDNGTWTDPPPPQPTDSRPSSSSSNSTSNSETKRDMPVKRGALTAKRGGSGSAFANWKMPWSSSS